MLLVRGDHDLNEVKTQKVSAHSDSQGRGDRTNIEVRPRLHRNR